MTVRFYSSISQQTTLTASISPSNTSIAVASTTGFPGSTPFTLALDYGGANEELVDVTMVAGLSLTVTRAVDSTPASSHNAGAIVRHVSSARDFRDSRNHENADNVVHGVTGDVVGTTDTQTLSNKTLDRATGDLENVDIYNTGPGNQFTVIGDSANPGVNRQAWFDNEINLRRMAVVDGQGGFYSYNPDGTTNNFYRYRAVDFDDTTTRFHALSGGTVGIFPTTTTTSAALGIGIQEADASNTQSAFQVSNTDGSAPRIRVFEDGRLGITPPAIASAFTPFFVQTPTGGTANTAWLDSGAVTRSFIRGDGTAFFRPRTLSGTPTALGDWSLIQSAAWSVGGAGFFNIEVSRINSNFSFGATGSFADQDLCSLPSNWLPALTTQPIMISSMSSDFTISCWLSPTANRLRLASGVPNGSININQRIWMTFSYPIAE